MQTAPDAVYLPPHHEAIYGLDAIREYLRGPLSHGVSDLAFDVTYITIWRQFQVRSDINLGQLHRILQTVMGWTNTHLHPMYSSPTCRKASSIRG